MTDDLEPRLRDHLRHRASRVNTSPDVADLHHRLGARERRTSRSLAAALVVTLLAGPVAGWAVARSTESERDTFALTGGDDDGGSASRALTEGYSPELLRPRIDAGLHPVSARTTEQGIRLVVQSSDLGQSNGPCVIDGLVRVAVVDRDLIDVVRFDTAPGGSSFLLAGTADARPMWVVVARGFEIVEATFPNGMVDTVRATDGLAVLAAYASTGESPGVLEDDVIQLAGTGMVDMANTGTATIADGSGGCSGEAPAEQVMPEPGEPPSDEEAARAEITDLFSKHGGGDPRTQVDLHEEPAVWLDAALRFQEQEPRYYEWAHEVYGVVEEIVFTAPDRATVRTTLKSDNPEIPAPGEVIGEAVLIDGMWKASIESSCAGLALAGIECDYSLAD